MRRKTTDEMIKDIQDRMNLLINERIIDSYTFDDPRLKGQFISVITEEDHVYFKKTYFYNCELDVYRFVTVNGCM